MPELPVCRLEELAEIRIGFKSLLNDFFYLDQTTIDRFEIEKEFLRPIFMRKDLDLDSYFQKRAPSRWVFVCRKSRADLRGTGAGAYVQWASRQETKPRKQTEKPVKWPEAPAVQASSMWYSPFAVEHYTQIAIRKAIGQRYAPALFERPTLLDQRMYIVLPKSGIDPLLIAAYLSSSLFPLALETHANLSLGSGYLTLATGALRRLPTLDLRKIPKRNESNILAAAKSLWKTTAPDASGYPVNDAIRRLDESILELSSIDRSRAEEVEREVSHFARVRLSLFEMRENATNDSASRDIGTVAEEVADHLRLWMAGRRFPEDYFAGSSMKLSISSTASKVILEPLLGTCGVEILAADGLVEYSEVVPRSVAEVVLRSMLLGRRIFRAPSDEAEADAVLRDYDSFLGDFEKQVDDALSKSGIGSRYQDQVQSRVFADLGIAGSRLSEPLKFGEWILQEIP